MNGMSPPDGCGRSFGKSDVTNFTLLHKIGHRANGLFDWRVRIDAVLVVEIDRVDIQPPQTGVASGVNVFRLSVDSPYGCSPKRSGRYRTS